jgi:hypothetical protein
MRTFIFCDALCLCACGPSDGVEPMPDALHCVSPTLLSSDGNRYVCTGPLGCRGGEQPSCDFRRVPDSTPCPAFSEGVSFSDVDGTVACSNGLWRRVGKVN